MAAQQTDSIENKWADWYRSKGLQVIPNDSVEKKPLVSWKQWQEEPILQKVHEEWKAEGKFNKGLAIILGARWDFNELKRIGYVVAIDCDDLPAVELAKKVLPQDTFLEAHGVPDKLHMLYFTNEQWQNEKIGRLEVKASKCLITVTPSLHKSGTRYQPIGKAVIMKTLESKPNFNVVLEGGRNPAFHKECRNTIHKNSKLSKDALFTEMLVWNQNNCSPPLEEAECRATFNSAWEYCQNNPRKGKHEDDEEKLKEVYLQKYTGDQVLHEAILVNKVPYFLKLEEDHQPALEESIETPTHRINPPAEYLNLEYSFSSLEEIKEFIGEAEKETLNTLYAKVKGVTTKYLDADDSIQTIIAADIIFTYFQDRIGQTHYLLFVGDNGTGKSNILKIFQRLGYRAFFMTDSTASNIFSYLGAIEEGQGIILEDEMDSIDSEPEKMRIWKAGYNAGVKVPRVDIPDGKRQQSGFFVYSFKAGTAERAPDSDKAKGLMDRTLKILCKAGLPQYDITEVINPAGAEEFASLLAELDHLRKVLLAYRLLHFSEPLEDIALDLVNREKQLSKPLIRLFQHEECRKDIENALYAFLNEKREDKQNTIEAKLCKVIRGLVNRDKSKILPFAEIWSVLRLELNGESIINKPQSMDTAEHGVLSQRQITAILKDKFGAKPRRQGREGERALEFIEERLQKMEKTYSIEPLKRIADRSDTTDTSDTSGKALTHYQQNQITDKNDVEGKETPETGTSNKLSEVSDLSDLSVEPTQCSECGEVYENKAEYEIHFKNKHGSI